MKLLLGDGLLTTDGDVHRRQRRLVQPAFHRQRVESYGDTMALRADELARRWRDGSTGGGACRDDGAHPRDRRQHALRRDRR